MTDTRCAVVTETREETMVDKSRGGRIWTRVPVSWCLHDESVHKDFDGVVFCQTCALDDPEYEAGEHPFGGEDGTQQAMLCICDGATGGGHCIVCDGIDYVTAPCCHGDEVPELHVSFTGQQIHDYLQGFESTRHDYEPGGVALNA
jgi:hypothetical protein